jgi:predicted ATP-dependent endonuclease of OLD family
MKLESVTIKNFKSIKQLKLLFTDNLYCLVGQNEIGKSNILQAISMLGDYVSKSEDEKKLLGKPQSGEYIEGIFKIDSNEIQTLRLISKSFNTGTISYNTNSIKSIKLTCNRRELSAKHFSILIDQDELPVADVRDGNVQSKLLNQLIELTPKFQYYAKEEFILNPFSLKDLDEKNNNTQLKSFKKLFELGGVNDLAKLSDLSGDEIIYQRESAAEKINSLLNQYYKSDYQFQIKLESHDGIFTAFFNDKYKKLDSLTQRSTGAQYFFSFLINKLHSKHFGKKNTVYLIDEPALSLHPTSQKKFIKLLEDFSQDNLVLYTTHSPFLINRMKPTRVWVAERNDEKGTYINPKPSSSNWRPLRSALGMDISDSFFYGDKTLLVEGPEDKIIIGSLIHYFSRKGKISLNSDLLSIIDAGSISNMPAMVQILIDDNRPMIVLIDNDDTKILNRLKAKVSQVNNKNVLAVITITDIKNDAISIEDLLPLHIYIQAVFNFVDYLQNEKIIIPKSSDPFAPAVPDTRQKTYTSLAKQITNSFKDPDGSELDLKVPVSKVGIAHEFEKLIESMSTMGTDEEEEVCLTLVKLVAENLKLL